MSTQYTGYLAPGSGHRHVQTEGCFTTCTVNSHVNI